MTYSLHALSVSAGRLGLAVLLACSSVSAQSLTPSHPGFKAPVPKRYFVTPDQAEFLSHITMVDLPDGQGGTVRTARISGLNVQVVNGSGKTYGTTNGLGNLIVGYNELGNPNGDDRTGSHNIVTGQENSFSSYGGLVAGQGNTVSDAWSSVSGGRQNTASGIWSSVSGGAGNTASGADASISGGTVNTASGIGSSVSGGFDNTASGYWSSVSGGDLRSATGTNNWAAGSLSESN